MGKRRVVIVGGGFGGIEAAKALDGQPVEVVLIDRSNYHLFQPLLYQVAMAGLSPAEIAAPIRSVLSDVDNVRVVLDEVTGVDFEKRSIALRAEPPLSYDWLVLAVGAQTSYFGHDDWEVAAPGLKRIEDALEIRRRVLLAFERAERETDARERKKLLTFVAIGGGPTGVELAGAIAELARFVLARDFDTIDPREAKVVLIEAGTRILPSFSEGLAQRAVEQLEELGVEIRTHTRVVSIDEHGVEYEDSAPADELPGLGAGRAKKRITSPTVVWAAGVRASGLTKVLGVETDRQGRVVVGSDCALPKYPEVFAVGDMARFEQNGDVLPGVSPVAMQQARYVAKLIRWELDSDGRPPREPFKYFDKGSMATIGRSRAIAEARGMKMSGFLAWLAWLFVHIWYLIGFQNRIVVLMRWAWSYVSYARGARLITSTGWKPGFEGVEGTGARHSIIGSPAPSPPPASRAPASDRPRPPVANPPA